MNLIGESSSITTYKNHAFCWENMLTGTTTLRNLRSSIKITEQGTFCIIHFLLLFLKSLRTEFNWKHNVSRTHTPVIFCCCNGIRKQLCKFSVIHPFFISQDFLYTKCKQLLSLHQCTCEGFSKDFSKALPLT